MSYTIPPSLKAILADANRVAPGRSHASDGTIGDLAHQAQGSSSDHNPDANGIVHAVDVTNDPAHGMDTWHWAQIISDRINAGLEKRVEYLVSNDGEKDVIFHPSVHGKVWVQNGAKKQEHTNHLHTSIKTGPVGENDITEYFVTGGEEAKPVPLEEDMFLGANFNYNGSDHLLWADQHGNVWHRHDGHTANFNQEIGIDKGTIDRAGGIDVKVFGNQIKVLMLSTADYLVVGKYDGSKWTKESWAPTVQ